MKHKFNLLITCIFISFGTGKAVAQNNASQVADLPPAQRTAKPVTAESKPQPMSMPAPRTYTETQSNKTSQGKPAEVKPEKEPESIALVKVTPALPGGEETKAILKGQTKSQDPVIFSPARTGTAESMKKPVLKSPASQQNNPAVPNSLNQSKQ